MSTTTTTRWENGWLYHLDANGNVYYEQWAPEGPHGDAEPTVFDLCECARSVDDAFPIWGVGSHDHLMEEVRD